MTAGAQLCELLPWDTEFFGVKVARLRGDLAPRQLSLADDWCRREGIDIAYLSVPVDATALARAAADAGFHFVDIRMVLEWQKHWWRPTRPITDAAIRPHRASDVEHLESIARTAHRDSRFYADGRFPVDRCDALYAAWIRRSCEEHASTVLVAERDGEVAGYLAHRTDPLRGTSTIDLVAVAADHRGHGIGSALLDASVTASLTAGADRVQVATQGRNLDALRLYQRAGMVVVAISVWLHKWYRDPQR